MPLFDFDSLFILCAEKCQFACKHCYVKDRRSSELKEVSIPLAEQFVKDFGKNATSVNLTGSGLPILHSNLEELIKTCKKWVRDVSINTRGKIDDNLLRLFRDYNVVVFYSIDWFGERADREMGTKGLWKSQIDTLNRMLEFGLDVSIRTTVMKWNYGDVLRLIDLIGRYRQRGFNLVWQGKTYIPYGGRENVPTAKQMAELTTICLNRDYCRIMEPWWWCINPPFRDEADKVSEREGTRICDAGKSGGRISLIEDGRITPCPFDLEEVGRYRYDKEYGWWADYNEIRGNLDKYLQLECDEKCRKCVFANSCGGGCRAVNNLGESVVCPIPELYDLEEKEP